jgi:hypothetical protein
MIATRAPVGPADAAAGRSAAAPAPGRCPVCADALGGARVALCARCETGHHLDCIEYAGECAIYGCGSRSYRTAREWHRLRSSLVPFPSGGGDQALRTLVDPALRIDARRVHRSRRIAAGIAAAAGGVLAGAAIVSIPPTMALAVSRLVWAIRDVATLWSFLHDVVVLAVLGLFGLVCSVRAAAFLGPFLVHLADGSHYILEPARRRLVFRTGALGIGFGERAWAADAIAGIDLASDRPGEPVELAMRLVDGSRFVLADDGCPYPDRYHRSDLTRIGRRLAAVLGVPFTVSLPPELPVK